MIGHLLQMAFEHQAEARGKQDVAILAVGAGPNLTHYEMKAGNFYKSLE